MRHYRTTWWSLTILLIFVVSLMSYVPALADDPPPPVETEEAITEEADEPTSEAEAPAVEEVPAGDAEQPAVEEDAPAGEEALSVPEILEAAPEGTTVVVLDESGEPLALATEEAAEVLITGDPQWCPEGVTPGSDAFIECTDPFDNFGDLLDELSTNQGAYNGAGTIFVAYNYNATAAGESTGVVIDYNDYALTDLVLQGGWDFSSDSVVGVTTFDLAGAGSAIIFENWDSKLTLRDFVLKDADGLFIHGYGDVTLKNVTVTDTVEGIVVDTMGEFKANGVNASGNDRGGLHVFSDSDVTIKNSNFDNNNGYEIRDENHDEFSDQSITVGATGLEVYSYGDVTLAGVSASGNSYNGAVIYHTGPYPLTDTADFPNVTVTNSIFNDNGSIGIEYGYDYTYEGHGHANYQYGGGVGLGVLSLGKIELDGVSANNNTGAGASLGLTSWFGAAESTENGNGIYNPEYGPVTVANSYFENNGSTGMGIGYSDWNDIAEEPYEHSSMAHWNGPGLWVNSPSKITLTNVSASGNYGHGAVLNNFFYLRPRPVASDSLAAVVGTNGNGLVYPETPAYDVTVTGSSFSNNGGGDGFYFSSFDSLNPEYNYKEEYLGSGLVINTLGNVTLTSVSANNNAEQGVLINALRESDLGLYGPRSFDIPPEDEFTPEFGDVKVICGEFIGNNQYGVYVNDADNVTLIDPLFHQNGA